MTELLGDFLQLLSIADEWDMPSLKAQITTEIVDNNRIIERFPHELQNSEFPDFCNAQSGIFWYKLFTVLKAAELYRADDLEKYLKDFKEQNGMLIDILIPKDSSG